ncbi:hypothetical protein AOQ84DRAFT_385268 [Glonium stellatum]|uniref:Uncharacterized protein n=1 Tax=Glonium stellatum TaxID=574774 RepID=A0A8E2FAL8_9PEZI|nr:hypothetical protein AOQ84DRAFT_385268 [Glonium stellatum]
MQGNLAINHLFATLEEHSISISKDNVLPIFINPKTKENAIAWIDEYLDPSTLLSKEELDLYCKISKKSTTHLIEGEDTEIRPHQDNDLSAAIAALQSSTAAIEKQYQVLEIQKEALLSLKALNKPNLSVEHMRNDRRRHEVQEKGRLDIAAEEVWTSVTEQLTAVQQDVKSEVSSLQAFTIERLSSDDQMLAALPKITSNIGTNPEIICETKSSDEWCRAIISFRSADIKAKVESTYQLNLLSRADSDLATGSREELLAEKKELQGELETLYAEIASVAQMVVEHDLREPLLRTKMRSEDQRKEAQWAWLTYVLSTLQFMTNRLDAIGALAQELNSFQKALTEINSTVSSETMDSVSESQPVPTKRVSASFKSLISPPFRARPVEKAQLPMVVQDILRHAGLSTHYESVEGMQGALATASLERDVRLQYHRSATTSSIDQSLAEAIGRTNNETQAVSNALFSNTVYKHIHFNSKPLELRISDLDAAIREIGDGIMNVDSEQLPVDEAKVTEFIGKWSYDWPDA